MGCTTDVINAKFKKEEDIKLFIDLFNEILKDDLYYDEYDLEDIKIEKEEDEYHIFFENEPMFYTADGIEITKHFVKEFVSAYPEIHFSMDYFCSYSNCGDVNLTEYSYSGNNKIFVKETYSDQEGIYMCEECEEDFDEPLVFFDEYDENVDYLCPECGAKNTLDVGINEYYIEFINERWEEKKIEKNNKNKNKNKNKNENE